MKTKTITLALAALTATSAINAQEATQPAHKTTFAKDKASTHWFLEIGDAATISLAGVNRNAAFGDRVSFLNPNLALGRWISPSFGMRLQLQGGKLYDFSRQLAMLPSGSTTVVYPRNKVSYGWAHLKAAEWLACGSQRLLVQRGRNHCRHLAAQSRARRPDNGFARHAACSDTHAARLRQPGRSLNHRQLCLQ